MELQIIDGIITKLTDKMVSNYKDITGLMYQKANYVKPQTYEFLSEYQPLTRAELFTECDTVFVKGSIKFPEEICFDEDYEDFMFLRFHNLGGIVSIDGKPYNGIDENRDRIPLKKDWAGQEKEILVEGYCLNHTYDLNKMPPTCMAYAYFARVDKKIEKYIYDLRLVKDWYVYDCANPQADNISVRKKLSSAFEASIHDLDISHGKDELRIAVERADQILRSGIASIDDGDMRSHLNLVASTHIDTAWLWQLKDTIRKCGHSFSNVLRLLDRYPEFKFTCSQVKLLEYTKNYYPELYKQIKEAVKAGRWENVGPMWVESDCNVVSGESVVRQILYGTDFLEKEFGTYSKIAWLPDTFGFQANLPQIFKKSGMDYFYTWKLHWQTQEKFPYGDFRWKGIDGSEILCSVINNSAGCYNGEPTPKQIRGTAEAFEQYGEIDEILFPYGYGDGGGGPTGEMIEYAKRLEDFPGMPKCEMTTANEFFQRLEKLRDELPVWYGELYLQTHRGTLSTEASGKKNNRRCEMLYQSLEKLGVMSELCGAEPDWDLLRRGWEKILVLQFHDILPGTSIDPVYEDCREIYREVYDIAKQFMDSIDVDAEISIGNGGKVVNTLSWDRDILARFKCPIKAIGDSDVKIVMNGENMPCSVKKTDDQAIITFLAKDVKAMSYKEFSVALEQENMTESVMDVVLNREGINVENDRYQALINHEGCIASLFDKKRKRQVLSGEGNDIRFFLDGPGVEDAWNLYDNYKNRQVSLFEQSDVMLTENNELRTVIHVHRSGQRVQFEQDIIFYHHSNRIDFETCVDWQEENKVMRVYFPTTMNAPYFTSEVGFGAYCRPSVNSTKFEKSKFEVVAHRWVDISENNYGVALLNDSKYGHDVRYNTIGLTLLRSTSFPANYPDKGTHQFTYSLLPHEESWDRAEVVQAGIELNAEKHTVSVIGRGKLIEGLATCNNKNVIIDTVKMAETGNGVMLRLYEANGTGGNAELSFGRKVRSVREVDLVEREIGDVALEENKIRFEVTPYEIRTFIIDFE